MKIAIVNGPNLNLTGHRQKEIYGSETFENYIPALREMFPQHDIAYFQSNVEGELINILHECKSQGRMVLLNAGGYTHTSVALRDAVSAIDLPVIEIHMSQIAAREEFRRTSFVGAACVGSIAGFGMDSYRLGILALESLS
ncbi:MAG: 3-dehydroquinate dehydratase [Bacteroides sp.]|nr:3-dehydroquinate dehydratase [Ruminococcus flavefaciens]MCM1554451.1 3-dehydroquinate dehydratase [Bacteroides sp.]